MFLSSKFGKGVELVPTRRYRGEAWHSRAQEGRRHCDDGGAGDPGSSKTIFMESLVCGGISSSSSIRAGDGDGDGDGGSLLVRCEEIAAEESQRRRFRPAAAASCSPSSAGGEAQQRRQGQGQTLGRAVEGDGWQAPPEWRGLWDLVTGEASDDGMPRGPIRSYVHLSSGSGGDDGSGWAQFLILNLSRNRYCFLSPLQISPLSLSLSLSVSEVRRPGRARKKRPNDREKESDD